VVSAPAEPVAANGWDFSRLGFQERLHEIYHELRESQPLTKSPAGFWAVSRFEDVFAIASDPATYSSKRTVIGPPGLVPTIRSLDPPHFKPSFDITPMSDTHVPERGGGRQNAGSRRARRRRARRADDRDRRGDRRRRSRPKRECDPSDSGSRAIRSADRAGAG
jgi:hypothetical protein